MIFFFHYTNQIIILFFLYSNFTLRQLNSKQYRQASRDDICFHKSFFPTSDQRLRWKEGIHGAARGKWYPRNLADEWRANWAGPYHSKTDWLLYCLSLSYKIRKTSSIIDSPSDEPTAAFLFWSKKISIRELWEASSYAACGTLTFIEILICSRGTLEERPEASVGSSRGRCSLSANPARRPSSTTPGRGATGAVRNSRTSSSNSLSTTAVGSRGAGLSKWMGSRKSKKDLGLRKWNSWSHPRI